MPDLLEGRVDRARQPGVQPQTSDEESIAELRALVMSKTKAAASADNGGDDVYRCQITESIKASTPLAVRDWSQYTAEVRSGNVGIFRFLKVAAWMTVVRFAHRLGRDPGMPKPAGESGRTARSSAFSRVSSSRFGHWRRSAGRSTTSSGIEGSASPKRCRRRAGSGSVKNRVDRLIDERTGKMIELKNDCIVLQGFVCKGDRSPARSSARARLIRSSAKPGSAESTTPSRFRLQVGLRAARRPSIGIGELL